MSDTSSQYAHPEVLVSSDWLAAHLPPYMVPSELLGCDAIPVSVNFKIDRVRLAADYHEAHLKAVNHGA